MENRVKVRVMTGAEDSLLVMQVRHADSCVGMEILTLLNVNVSVEALTTERQLKNSVLYR